ncbi:hypothetical protein EVJ58_g2272 [Rhodofomes roseus]|uniref:C3H1-type domain-containing protein n=1 Tax=Rhodofomes roseus TaxID=34475 RepID=A0A4Y9YTD4_9APHY|nr:hypothetical protein EVJ58_g2272 [Rhodofomes roseus]
MTIPDPPWKQKTRPCPFYSQGRCLFSDSCNFLHDVKAPRPETDSCSTSRSPLPSPPESPVDNPTFQKQSRRNAKVVRFLSPSRSPRLSSLLLALGDTIQQDQAEEVAVGVDDADESQADDDDAVSSSEAVEDDYSVDVPGTTADASVTVFDALLSGTLDYHETASDPAITPRSSIAQESHSSVSDDEEVTITQFPVPPTSTRPPSGLLSPIDIGATAPPMAFISPSGSASDLHREDSIDSGASASQFEDADESRAQYSDVDSRPPSAEDESPQESASAESPVESLLSEDLLATVKASTVSPADSPEPPRRPSVVIEAVSPVGDDTIHDFFDGYMLGHSSEDSHVSSDEYSAAPSALQTPLTEEDAPALGSRVFTAPPRVWTPGQVADPCGEPVGTALAAAVARTVVPYVTLAVLAPVAAAVRSSVASAVRANIALAVCSPVALAVCSPIAPAVCAPITHAICLLVASTICSPIASAIFSPVVPAVLSPVVPAILSTVASQFYSSIASAALSVIAAALSSAVYPIGARECTRWTGQAGKVGAPHVDPCASFVEAGVLERVAQPRELAEAVRGEPSATACAYWAEPDLAR